MTSAFCLVELDSIVYFIINLHVRHHHFVNFWEINKKHRFSGQHDIWSLSSVLEVLQWLHVNVPKWLDIIRKFIHLKVVIADVSEWITRELTLDLQERIVSRHRSGENCKYVSAALKVWCLKQKFPPFDYPAKLSNWRRRTFLRQVPKNLVLGSKSSW